MCNKAAARYTPPDLDQSRFSRVDSSLELPRRHIAPTTPIPAIVNRPSSGRVLTSLRWGNPATPYSTTNARDDRLDSAPTWKGLLASPTGRCIIVVSAIFEPFDKKTLAAVGEAAAIKALGGAVVQAAKKDTVWHRGHLKDNTPFGIAGLAGKAGDVDWGAMATVPATARMAEIHRPVKSPAEGRQVAYLPPKLWDAWLDPVGHPDWHDVLMEGQARSSDIHLSLVPMGAMKKTAGPDEMFQTWTPPRGQGTLF